MANVNVKADNYVSIQGWMITELGLKNAELVIYALIYGFSQDGRSSFVGSVAYLQEWTSSSKQTVHTCLNELVQRGLIIKGETTVAGQKAICYRAVPRKAQEEDSPKIGLESQKIGLDSQKIGLEAVQNLDSDNYSNIDNSINNTYTPPPAGDDECAQTDEELKEEFKEVWATYPRRQGRQQALKAYMAARRNGTSGEAILDGIVRYKRYIDESGMIMRWVIQGGRYFEEHRWEDEQPPAAVPPEKAANPALGYRQRKYTRDDLKRIGVDFGDDDDDV